MLKDDRLRTAKQTLWLTAIAGVLLSVSIAAQELPNAKPNLVELFPEEVEEIRRYSVEIIVFEYASGASAGNEIFESMSLPQDTGVPESIDLFGKPLAIGDEGDAVVYGDQRSGYRNDGSDTEFHEFGEFDDPASLPEEDEEEIEIIPALSSVDFRLLTLEEMTMGGIHEKMLSLDAYKPVLWGGWVQAVYEHETIPPVRLRRLGTPPLYFDGTLNLYLKNYLHLAVDITRELQLGTVQAFYRQEKPRRGQRHNNNRTTYGVTDSEVMLFHIQEDRIFNSGHLRYYDHPRFGLLARVNRMEEMPEVEEDGRKPTMLSNER